MIRFYLEEHYLAARHSMADQYRELQQWLEKIDADKWAWGLTKFYGHPRCLYLRDREDAIVFSLKFNLHKIVYEKTI